MNLTMDEFMNSDQEFQDEMFVDAPIVFEEIYTNDDNSDFDYELMSDDDMSDISSPNIVFIENESSIYDEISEISDDGIDLFLTKLYRYYLNRGYWNIIVSQITQLIIFMFFSLFCLFIFGAVDYSKLFSFRDPSKTYLFSDVVHLDWLRAMNPYFIISLIIFGLYVCWKIIRIIYDAKVMWAVGKFYKNNLQLTDFELPTTRWTLIVKRLNDFLQMKGYEQLESWNISARIMKKDNYLIAMIHHQAIKYGIPLFPESWDNNVHRCIRHIVPESHAARDGERFKLKIFGRILLWSISYCIINFIVNERNEIRNEIMYSDREHIREDLRNELKKKIRIISVLNFLLIPFLALFVPLYTLFHYGEEFYKNPSNASNREWVFFAKWKFREYNELPHIFKARMHISSKYAEQYLGQFPYGIYENVGKLFAFISSSVIVYLVAICVINETVLINVELTPAKSVYWWIIMLSTIWVISRNILKEQPIFFPEKKMEKLWQFLHYIPDLIRKRPNSLESIGWIKKYYQFKIIQLLQEILSIFVNPFVLWFKLGSDENIDGMIKFVRESTIEHSRLGKICEYSVFEIDSQRDKILRGGDLEAQQYTSQHTDSKVENSIKFFNCTSESDVEGIVGNVGNVVNTNMARSDLLIDELDENAGVFEDTDQNAMFQIISQHKPSGFK